MILARVISSLVFACVCAGWASAQDAGPDPILVPRPQSPSTLENPTKPRQLESVRLIVPRGMAIQIALDKEVRIRKVGQAISGRVVEPVYAFDKLVVPVGTIATGQIIQIAEISHSKRTLEALNAEFTPAHEISVEFTDFSLPSGQHISIHTHVIVGSGQVIQFVTASALDKKLAAKDSASEKLKDLKEEAKREWTSEMQQLKQTGKVRKLERYAIAQLPIHPQYIEVGTVYLAELQEPLDFGSEELTPQMAASLSSPVPNGSLVRARLVTPLSSGTSQKNDRVEAIVSRPLFDGDCLILPQGAVLRGSVVQAEPARHMSRNGQLRFVFHDLVLPGGLDQKVSAVLTGIQAGKTDHLKLDSEGGARATSPKTRYLLTGIALGLAAVSAAGDGDADISNKAAGGANGFKLVGIALGVAVRSQPLGIAMGALGASRSVYVHFIARGRDVVFPENTEMQIGIGVRSVPQPEQPGFALWISDDLSPD